MAIALSFQHIDGLRLRQQVAQAIREEKEGTIVGAKEWHFEKIQGTHEDAVVKVDLDPRTQKPLDRYSAMVNYGLKNVVIERKGAITHLQFRNSSVRNQLRIKYQNLTGTGKKNKDGVEIKEWKDSPTPAYLAPQMWGGVAVGDGTRAILDEMPT